MWSPYWLYRSSMNGPTLETVCANMNLWRWTRKSSSPRRGSLLGSGMCATTRWWTTTGLWEGRNWRECRLYWCRDSIWIILSAWRRDRQTCTPSPYQWGHSKPFWISHPNSPAQAGSSLQKSGNTYPSMLTQCLKKEYGLGSWNMRYESRLPLI